MKFKLLLVVILIFSFSTSCNTEDDKPVTTISQSDDDDDNDENIEDEGDENEDEEGFVVISGIVLSSLNIPEANVQVSITDFENLTAVTDAEGYFEITDVPQGDLEVVFVRFLDENDTSVFVQRTMSITTETDYSFSSVSLPNEIELSLSEVTSTSALLTWTMSTDNGFTEYKLVREQNSEELNEDTGTVLFETNNVNEISFLDETIDQCGHYYRLYVYNLSGLICSTNIVTIESIDDVAIVNGSFEEITADFPNFWTIDDSSDNDWIITSDFSDATDGNYSLRFTTSYNGETLWEEIGIIRQTLCDFTFVPGKNYKFTIDFKSNLNFTNIGCNLIFGGSQGTIAQNEAQGSVSSDGEWYTLDRILFLPEDFINEELYLLMEFEIFFYQTTNGSIWIDNLRVEEYEEEEEEEEEESNCTDASLCNFFRNCSFESITDDNPSCWTPEANDDANIGNPNNSFVIDNAHASDGSNSAKFYHADENACWEQWLRQRFDDNLLTPGATYRLKYDYRSDFTLANGETNIFIRNNSLDLNEYWYMGTDFYNDGVWRTHEFEFTLPNSFTNNNVSILVHFCLDAQGNYWVDNLSLEQI